MKFLIHCYILVVLARTTKDQGFLQGSGCLRRWLRFLKFGSVEEIAPTFVLHWQYHCSIPRIQHFHDVIGSYCVSPDNLVQRKTGLLGREFNMHSVDMFLLQIGLHV